MSLKHYLAAAALPILAACSRSSPTAPDPAPGPVASSAAPVVSAAPAAPSIERWTGTYKSAAATMYIPRGDEVPNAKDWDGVKFRGDDAGIGLGDGTLELTRDPTSGRITGTVDGSVGPALVSGAVEGGRFTATIRRKDPADEGLTGTAMGEVSGDKIEGTMKLAESNAKVVRAATFTVAKATR